MNIKKELDKIGLTPDNSIVIGSGILNALGIRETKDIDVVVDEDAYSHLSSDNRFEKRINHAQEVLTDDIFEIGISWKTLDRVWRFNDFLTNSVLIDNVRYLTLQFLLDVKRSWLKDKDVRQKDIDDVKLIEDNLKYKKLYRYTADGEGIWSAGKRLLPESLVDEAWETRKWMPKPQLPEGDYRFYLTEKGKEKYDNTLLKTHQKYLSNIKSEEIDPSTIEKAVYEDGLQVVVENNNFCTLYLVRHGETEWNRKGIVMGQSDSPLTEEGVEQVKQTAQELKNVPLDAIFSSDLHRAQKSAEIMKLERQLAIQTSKALRERTYGRWEGKMGEDYRKNFQHLFDKVKQLSEKEAKSFKFANDIESDKEVIGRFITQLREIAVAYPNKTVLVVSHGGCIRTFLMHLGYGEMPVGSFSNAGYVKVICDGIDFFIKEVKGVNKSNNSE